jgi:hypothetical protein
MNTLIKRTNWAVVDDRPQRSRYRPERTHGKTESDSPKPRTRFGSQRAEVLVLG